MNILLTFTGLHDPYSVGLVGDEEQRGPILSLIGEKSFNTVILFSTPNTAKNTLATEKAIKKLQPDTNVEIRHLQLDDPTDYISILKGLRNHIRDITEDTGGASYFISVASGTPQMHACWVLLTASGEIPAHILHVRPPRFVSRERPIISEVDLSQPAFPIIRPNICSIDAPESSPDTDSILRQLGIIGDHPDFKKALEVAATLAVSAAPILILGETGTGKEVIARFTHLLSGRPAGKFVPINCAAIPENLVESLLFGHRKGAFTGATTDQAGKFDQADRGTLFLDELGELPLPAQAKLLRVLQDGLIEAVGDKKPHKVNVRIIAATNKDIERALKKGIFREDLYYRLNIGEIRLPSLRERKTDIPKIALHVLDRINATMRKPKRLSPSALVRLQNHIWRGNIRDLENAIERSVRLTRHDVLEADDLIISEPSARQDPLTFLPDPHEGFSIEEFISSARKQMLMRALEMSDRNKSKAARLLGITPLHYNRDDIYNLRKVMMAL